MALLNSLRFGPLDDSRIRYLFAGCVKGVGTYGNCVGIPTVGLEVEFAAGEEIRTEISAKFTRARLEADYAAAGLEPTDWFTDPESLFALTLARPR